MLRYLRSEISWLSGAVVDVAFARSEKRKNRGTLSEYLKVAEDRIKRRLFV